MKTQVAELDLFYLSYDEPNCEEHWADILNKVPWAKRVHGVKGFDAAHKACANQSDTDRFITIDADNIVNETFFDQELIMPDSNSIYSWNAKNMLNGLCYGNGGVKCWPKQYVLDMKTHEAADDDEGALVVQGDKPAVRGLQLPRIIRPHTYLVDDTARTI